jgi:hypothetical protein
MTFYEHAMLGATLALAGGAHRRHGWGLVATAAVAAALPDWDGLSLLFGPTAYAGVHRLWGHNVLAAVVAGAVVGSAGYLCALSSRLRAKTLAALGRLEPRWKTAAALPDAFSGRGLAVWVCVGVLAASTHLPADLIYSGAPGLPDWGLKFLWPFSQREWSYPVVPWGDLATTLVFVAEMFALLRWPGRAQLIAVASLLAVAAYVAVRATAQA